MFFPTLEFFVFFTLILVLNWFFKKWPFIWRLFLLGASCFFYSLWDTRLLLILSPVILFNFLSAWLIYIYRDFFIEKRLLFILAIIFNLFTLGLFRYYDFFRESFEVLLLKSGFSINLPLLEIILPVGLSFYIFRAISYNADVYLKKIIPTFSILDFSIYLAFFPHLLSGPIMRANDFLIQLKNGGAKKIENLYENITLIFLGLFKKIVISSYLTLAITDDVFAVPENYSSFIIFLAILSYTLVIYFDFSGYSDMAIGFAGLLGFRTPINFNFPYLATSLRDFWRRWHITLSEWVRDYIYIPLGGAWKGKIREYFNLMTAMILIGLWHGPAGHFIIWGFLHGTGLVAAHFYLDRKKTHSLNDNKKWQNKIKKFFGWFTTFTFVSFSWIFFRSDSLYNAFGLIKTLFNFQRLVEPFKIYILFLVLFGFLFFLFEKQIINRFVHFQQKLPFLIWLLILPFFAVLIFKLGPDLIPPFVYFKF